MRKIGASLLIVMLLLVVAAPSLAWANGRHGHRHFHGGHFHHGFGPRVFIGVGPAFWWGATYPWWYYRPAYPAYYPSPVVVQEPPVYIQQQPTPASAPSPEGYWYYCPGAKSYYPEVQTCAEAWIKVPPRTEEKSRP